MSAANLAHPRARAALDLLERVLPLIPRLPDSLERSLSALSRFLERSERDTDDLATIEAVRADVIAASAKVPEGRAREALIRAAELLLGARGEAIEELTRAQRQALKLRAAPSAVASAARFRASIGIPSLHVLAGSPLPLVAGANRDQDDTDDIDDDEADDTQRGDGAQLAEGDRSPDSARYEEILAWVREGPEAWGAEDVDEDADVQRIARDCLEDIGIFSSLRRANEGEPWSGVARFEQRLLDNLDALIALSTGGGPDGGRRVLAAITGYTAEISLDPGRAFTLVFTLGSIDGAESLRSIGLALRRSNPHVREAQLAAVALAPHSGIDGAMRRLLDDEDPDLVRLALTVLRFRRAPAFGGAVQLLHHPDPEVVKAAAACLAITPQRVPAVRALEERLDTCADDEIGLAIAESLIALGAFSGLVHARRCLMDATDGGERAPLHIAVDAARLVSLAGEARDGDLLAKTAKLYPGCTASLGWFGHVGICDAILGALDRAVAASDRPLAAASSEALVRILGGGPGISPLDDPAAFRAWWQRSRDRFTPGQKYRSGALFTPLASLAEIEAEETPARDRARLAFEISLAIGEPSAIEVRSWVARQREEIARARRRLEGGEVAVVAGQWPRQWLGDRQG